MGKKPGAIHKKEVFAGFILDSEFAADYGEELLFENVAHRKLITRRTQRAWSFEDPGYKAKFVSHWLIVLVVRVADHVDDDGAGEDEDVILAVGDVHAVGVGPGKPFFRDLGDGLIATGEGVFHVHETALSFQVVGARDINGETAFEEGE